MLNKLKDILDYVDYAGSEVYSAIDSLPDYRTNESSRDYLSQAESYIDNVRDMVLEIVSEMNTEDDTDAVS
jgi:vacuolar-type H+-ATPase subunit E/Vma4